MEGSDSTSTKPASPRWRPKPGMHEPGTLRPALVLVTMSCGFWAVFNYIVTGAALTRFARAVQMEEFWFGVLAAIPFAGLLVQIPASFIIEHAGDRKRIFLVYGLIHRGLWLVIAAIPWLPQSIAPPAVYWWLLIVIHSISVSLANINNPAWVVWMADLVPAAIRGRYFARRGQVGRFVGLATTLAVGWALDHFKVADPLQYARIISIAFAIGALAGMVDILLFARVPDFKRRRQPGEAAGPGFFEVLGRPLRDPNFRRFVAFNAVLNFGIGYIGQFAWLYLLEVVYRDHPHANWIANVMLVAVPIMVTMVTFPIWGRLVDRLGCRPVLIIAGVLITHGAVSWVFVTQDRWWIGYIAVLSATAAWPGIELANQTLLFGLSSSDHSGEHAGRGGSAYVAIFNFAIGIAGIASGIFGGIIAHHFKDWHTDILGWPVTYHGLLFAISAVLRLGSLLFLIGMHEPEAHTARAAMRFITAGLYSNIQQVATLGVKGLILLRKIRFWQ
jgi:MFS family permease